MAAELALQGDIELTVAEVANLMCCDNRSIQRYVKSGKLSAVERPNERNRPTYYIPLTALGEFDPKLVKRYLKGSGSETIKIAPPVKEAPSFEQYTLLERQQINFWTSLLEEWKLQRVARDGTPKAEVDTDFVGYAKTTKSEEFQELFGREFRLSRETLYRRWACLRAEDTDGLIDKRGKATKGRSGIENEVWEAFLSFFLDQRQYPISRCYEYARLYTRKKFPELEAGIPHVASFYRRIERDVPIPLRVLGREGEKAWNDRCAPYISRYMGDMESDEWWVGDCHTLDVISDAGDGKTHRLYLIAFFDPRSYTFVGCRIVDKINSQAVVATLGKCIRKRQNRPKNFYVDNGREFLAFDVGGRGHRTRKKNKNEFSPPTILQRLDIEMVNALPRNGQAKLVERAFLDVKNQLSRLFPTFTGGNVVERPEILTYNLKKGKAVADQELCHTIEYLLDWYFNQQPYGGMIAKDNGKPRMQVYEENLHERRATRESDLNLMLMRSSRLQTINKRGVWLDMGDEKIEFFNEVTQNLLFGTQVYYRYDPEDLSEVRIYHPETHKLLTVAPMDEVMKREYGSNKEDMAAAMRKKRSYKKAVEQMLENSVVPDGERIEAVELIMTLAQENEAAAAEKPMKKVKTIHYKPMVETAMYDQAVGLDMDFMLENAERHYKGGNDDEPDL